MLSSKDIKLGSSLGRISDHLPYKQGEGQRGKAFSHVLVPLHNKRKPPYPFSPPVMVVACSGQAERAIAWKQPPAGTRGHAAARGPAWFPAAYMLLGSDTHCLCLREVPAGRCYSPPATGKTRSRCPARLPSSSRRRRAGAAPAPQPDCDTNCLAGLVGGPAAAPIACFHNCSKEPQ